jgi:2-keto-4-pentenoate hydratase/2-oxohepta-3-ene-1,7-dioic acid hydratase in catechol pathway
MQLTKVGRFETNGETIIGRLVGDRIEVLSETDDLPGILALGGEAPRRGRELALHSVRFLPPIHPSARVFAVAVNYRAHGKEANAKPPARPLIFYKAPSNFVGHGATLNPNTELTSKFDYEGEIAVVIGRRCGKVAASSALDFIAGVCPFDDGSARDLGKLEAGDSYWPDWTAAKGLDGASAAGPTIACGPAITDAVRKRSLVLTTRLNDEVVQEGRMTDMIFSTEQIIATLSSYMVLLPGDVIATGTPAGVGMGRNRFLKTGDRLEISIVGIDSLQVTVG